MPSPEPIDAAEARKRRTILIVGSIIVLAMTYGSGMSAEMHTAKKINEQLTTANSDLRVAQMDLRTSQALVQQLEARRQLDLALAELDSRNFGTAEAHLQEAATRLQVVETVNAYAKAHPTQKGETPYQPPVSTLDLSGLAAQIKSTTLPPAADVGAERDRVLGFARQLDDALGSVVPKADTPISAVTVKPPTLNDVPEMPGNDVTRTM